MWSIDIRVAHFAVFFWGGGTRKLSSKIMYISGCLSMPRSTSSSRLRSEINRMTFSFLPRTYRVTMALIPIKKNEKMPRNTVF